MTTLPRNVDDLYPLTPMQHLMLLHALAEEGNGVLLNQVVYDIRGALDAAALRHAWGALIARHPALRTAFLWEGLRQPVQAVRSTVQPSLHEHDLSALAPEARADALEAMRRDDATRPFALEKAPLMRAMLVRLAPDHHQLLWAIHHLVIDRWSHAILLEELRLLYDAARRQAAAALAPAAPFRAYVDWMARQDAAAVERHWRDALAGFTTATPLLRGSRALRTGTRATAFRALPTQEARALFDLAAAWRVTPGAVLQGAVGLWLAARSGRDDVVYGLTVSGRPADLPDAATIVGSLVSNVPVRLRCAPSQALGDWLQEIHRGEGRRQRVAHASPAQLREWSDVPPGDPLFDTLLLLNPGDPPPGDWHGITWEAGSATLDAGYPFLVAVGGSAGELGLTLVHDAGIPGGGELLEELAAIVALLGAAPAEATVGSLLAQAAAARRLPPSDAAPLRQLQAGATVHPGSALPDDPLAADLLRVWREVLDAPALGLDDDFFAAGGTSLQAAQLFVRIERITGRTLPLSTLFGASSVRALLATLGRPVPRRTTLVALRSSGQRPPLYAVPGIGGNIVHLHGVARHLGAEQPFAAFESPGLDGREAPLGTIEAIAQRYVDDLRPVLPDGEYHLLGICWGAAVAFEMAGRLAASGRPPTSVALLDPAALLREEPAAQASSDVGFVRARLELYWDEFREGSWRDRSRLVADKARRASRALIGGAAAEESRAELHLRRVRDANTAAVTRYAPRPGTMRACLFLTADRDLATASDPRLEWCALITPTPDRCQVAGQNSGDAIAPAHVAGFVRSLQEWIDAASHAARAMDGERGGEGRAR